MENNLKKFGKLLKKGQDVSFYTFDNRLLFSGVVEGFDGVEYKISGGDSIGMCGGFVKNESGFTLYANGDAIYHLVINSEDLALKQLMKLNSVAHKRQVVEEKHRKLEESIKKLEKSLEDKKRKLYEARTKLENTNAEVEDVSNFFVVTLKSLAKDVFTKNGTSEEKREVAHQILQRLTARLIP